MERFNIYDGWGIPINLKKLKKWIAEAEKKGNTHFRTKISWGFYDDIDELELEAVKNDE